MDEIKKMTYSERLRYYESEKRQLWNTNLSAKEYEKEIKKLADKWKI